MHFGYSPYMLPLVGAALVLVIMAVYAWTNRSTPGAWTLSLLSLVIAIWAGGYALEIAGTDLTTKYVWGDVSI